MRLHLARHGETTAAGRFLGQSDPPLSEEGRAQSEALAERFAGKRVERIVSSALVRSRETAAFVSARLGLPVEVDACLNEIAYGEWDGLPWAEIERRWPSEAARKIDDWWGVTPPAGESAEAFFARIRGALDALEADGRDTLLVGHAAVNGLIHEWSRGSLDSPRTVLSFRQGFGETLEIRL